MKKIELGQFFTESSTWLLPHIQSFIDSVPHTLVVDPFAGGGDLLKLFPNTTGYDIDPTLGWTQNDSLRSIPKHYDDLCVTNPPYLAKTVTSRRGFTNVKPFFTEYPQYDDLYLIGLHQCLMSFDYGVAIIPETYQLHSQKSKRITSLTILETNPFSDTETPTCVITWAPDVQTDYRVYKDDKFIGNNSDLVNHIPTTRRYPKSIIRFNDPHGNLGVKCIDDIQFMSGDLITAEIKGSSRTYTRLAVDSSLDINTIITECNHVLAQYRNKTQDTQLAPFKGNRDGVRRRRLDFKTCRAIVETALDNLNQ